MAITWGSVGVEPRPVVISTDCGCCFDDPWAIAHLILANDRVRVLGVLSSHSPDIARPTAESALSSIKAVLATLPNARGIPVKAGAEEGLIDAKTPRKTEAVDFLIKESQAFDKKRRLTVALLGPATDVASALLIDPALADRIEVVAMGFLEWPAGGDPYNVKHDVIAWRILLESNTPIVVADQKITTQKLILTREQLKVKFGSQNPTARHLTERIESFLDKHPALAERLAGRKDAAAVWDQGVTAFLLGLAKVEERPRPRLNDDRTFDHTAPRGKIGWVTEIDADALWNDLAKRLAPAE